MNRLKHLLSHLSIFSFAAVGLFTINEWLNSVQAKQAKCLLIVNGKKFIDGRCTFSFTEQNNGSFSFDDERIRIRCAVQGYREDYCPPPYQKVVQLGTFGSLGIVKPGVGYMSWNGGYLNRSLVDHRDCGDQLAFGFGGSICKKNSLMFFQ